jgi:hypothetical protein
MENLQVPREQADALAATLPEHVRAAFRDAITSPPGSRNHPAEYIEAAAYSERPNRFLILTGTHLYVVTFAGSQSMWEGVHRGSFQAKIDGGDLVVVGGMGEKRYGGVHPRSAAETIARALS